VPRPPGGIKRGKGKQRGAPGAALSPVENPGRRVPAYPQRCGVCQAGPNLQTLAVYLLVVHAIPVERTCQVIADLTGARVSPGFVHGMLARAAALLEAFETLTKMLIILSYVVHFDETTLRAGGKGTKQYVWTASTALYTSYYLGDRSGASFRASGIGPSLHGSVIVHDRLDLYDRQAPAGVSHQLCGSHLVRDLDSAA